MLRPRSLAAVVRVYGGEFLRFNYPLWLVVSEPFVQARARHRKP